MTANSERDGNSTVAAADLTDVPGVTRGSDQGARRQRLLRWAGILSAYFGAQSVVQLLGITAGLLLIRNMPIQEFALYTLATSVINFCVFATDLGSTTSLVHFYRQTGAASAEFARYLRAVLSLRRGTFLLGAAIVAVAFPVAARVKGFARVDTALATVAILLAVAFQITSAVRVLALRLHDRFSRSYRAEVAGAVLRLLLAAGMVVSALLRSWLGLLTAAAGSALTAWMSRDGEANPTGSAHPAATPSEEEDLRPYRRAVIRYLIPTLPSAVYFAVQGPLIVWLAATFGGSRNIAEVGALTRLGLLVGIFSGLTGVVFLPRLARIRDERTYRVRTLQFGSLLALLATTLFLAALTVPEPFLWLLGPHYSGLHRELLLVVAGSGLSLLDGYLVNVNLARAWTKWQSAAAALLVVSQIVAVTIVPMGTTHGVLAFNLLSAAVALVTQTAILAVGFSRPRWVTWH